MQSLDYKYSPFIIHISVFYVYFIISLIFLKLNSYFLKRKSYFFKIQNIDGGLIGGASLNPEEFMKIIIESENTSKGDSNE